MYLLLIYIFLEICVCMYVCIFLYFKKMCVCLTPNRVVLVVPLVDLHTGSVPPPGGVATPAEAKAMLEVNELG